MKTLFVISILFLGGCVSDFIGPDGRVWHSTQCTYLDDCYMLAGRECPAGYGVKRAQESKEIESFAINHAGHSADVTRSSETTLIFTCK